MDDLLELAQSLQHSACRNQSSVRHLRGSPKEQLLALASLDTVPMVVRDCEEAVEGVGQFSVDSEIAVRLSKGMAVNMILKD